MNAGDLDAALDSDDPEVRRRAVSAIPEAGGALPAEALRRALGDGDWRVRKEAIHVAVTLAPSHEALHVLVQALAPGDNVGLRNAVVEAIGGYGADAVAALSGALPDLDSDGRKLAAEGLARTSARSALAPLVQLVADGDVNVRAAAVEAIAVIGASHPDVALPPLVEAVRSGDAAMQRAALDGLNALGAAISWDLVAPLADIAETRRAALLALARADAPRAVPVLIAAFEHARGSGARPLVAGLADCIERDPAAAAVARAELGARGAAVDRIILLSSDDEAVTRRSALIVLGAAGTEVAALACLALLDDEVVAEQAELALMMIGEPAVAPLAAWCRRGGNDEAARGFVLLGRIAPPGAASARLFASAVDDASPEVARAALGALGRVGDASVLDLVVARALSTDSLAQSAAALGAGKRVAARHADAVRALAARALGDPASVTVAALAAVALGGPPTADVAGDVDRFANLASHALSTVRRLAVEALGALASPTARTPLVFALSDEEPDVRAAAIAALGRLRDAAGAAVALDELFALLDDPDAESVAAALVALGSTGDSRVVARLRPMVRAPRARVAVAAVEALATAPDPRRLEAIIDALGHEDVEVVKAALAALARENDARVTVHLGASLDHAAWDVRRLSADLLGRIGGAVAEGLLRARLPVEGEALVSDAITRALLEIETSSGRRSAPPGTGKGGAWP